MSSNQQYIIAKRERIKGMIMPLLNWSNSDLYDFKTRCGCAYLQNYMPQYPELIDELINTTRFWQWWSNQWLLRDEAFVAPPGMVHVNREIVVMSYKALHNPVTLALELRMDSLVFENTSISQKPR